MERAEVLLPQAIWSKSIEIVSATFLPRTACVWLLAREAMVVEVDIERDSLADFHRVEETVCSSAIEKARNPIATLYSAALMIRRTHCERAPVPERVWS
jgi:hypothetical protein